jgi:hypothetical protein
VNLNRPLQAYTNLQSIHQSLQQKNTTYHYTTYWPIPAVNQLGMYATYTKLVDFKNPLTKLHTSVQSAAAHTPSEFVQHLRVEASVTQNGYCTLQSSIEVLNLLRYITFPPSWSSPNSSRYQLPHHIGPIPTPSQHRS